MINDYLTDVVIKFNNIYYDFDLETDLKPAFFS